MIKDLNDVSPMRRLNLILPPAVRRAKPVGKNDRQLVDAKAITIAIWNGWQFSFDLHRVHALFFRMFGLQDHDVRPALERAESERWINIETQIEPYFFLRVSEQVFRDVDDSKQSQLPFPLAHHDLALDEIELDCAGLRSLFPQRLMFEPGIYTGHKLHFIYARVMGGFDASNVPINYNDAGRELGIDRTTARHSFERLAALCDMPVEKINGGMNLYFPSTLYFPWESDAAGKTMVVGFVGEQVGFLRSGDETGNSSPLAGDETGHPYPTGDATGISSPPSKMLCFDDVGMKPADRPQIRGPIDSSVPRIAPPTDTKNQERQESLQPENQAHQEPNTNRSDPTHISNAYLRDALERRFSPDERRRSMLERICKVCREPETWWVAQDIASDIVSDRIDAESIERHLNETDAANRESKIRESIGGYFCRRIENEYRRQNVEWPHNHRRNNDGWTKRGR